MRAPEKMAVFCGLALLAALYLPSLAKTLDEAHQETCVNNLRQMAKGVQLYIQDYDGRAPDPINGSVWWWWSGETDYQCGNGALGRLVRAKGIDGILLCPAARQEKDLWQPGLAYAHNKETDGLKFSTFRNPAKTVMFIDSNAYQIGRYDTPEWGGQGFPIRYRHSGKANTVFFDGHAAQVSEGDITLAGSLMP